MNPEKRYYVDVPVPVARARWADFEHELNFPGSGLEVRFDAVAGEPGRTRLSITGEEARMDPAVRRFRLFLEGRGLVDSTSGLRR
jgi:hypothetical protein